MVRCATERPIRPLDWDSPVQHGRKPAAMGTANMCTKLRYNPSSTLPSPLICTRKRTEIMCFHDQQSTPHGHGTRVCAMLIERLHQSVRRTSGQIKTEPTEFMGTSGLMGRPEFIQLLLLLSWNAKSLSPITMLSAADNDKFAFGTITRIARAKKFKSSCVNYDQRD
jgi:hypothetical protein